MPELIAAFVTPNHPAVSGILKIATDYLRKWGKDPSITGYQSRNADVVKLQMAAVYAALQSKILCIIIRLQVLKKQVSVCDFLIL